MTARHMQPLISAGLWRTATAGQQCSVSRCKHPISAASHLSTVSTSAELQNSELCPALPCPSKFCSFAAASVLDTPLGYTEAQPAEHDRISAGQPADSPSHRSQTQQWRDPLIPFGFGTIRGSAMHPHRGFSLGLTTQERAASAPLRHNSEGVNKPWKTRDVCAPECSYWSAPFPHSSPYSAQPISGSHSLGWAMNPTGNVAGPMRSSLQHQVLVSVAARPQGVGLSGGGSYGAAAAAVMGCQQVRGMAGGGGAWAKGHRSKMAMLRNKDGGDTGPQMRVNSDITAPEVRVVYEDNTHQVLTIEEALREAIAAKQDLVEVQPRAVPPVCRFQNFGKAQYAAKLREKEQKKKLSDQQRRQTSKDIRLSAFTGDHDVQMKLSQALEFLLKGHRVRIMVGFPDARGYEAANAMLKRAITTVGDKAVVMQRPLNDRPPKNFLIGYLTPTLEVAAKTG